MLKTVTVFALSNFGYKLVIVGQCTCNSRELIRVSKCKRKSSRFQKLSISYLIRVLSVPACYLVWHAHARMHTPVSLNHEVSPLALNNCDDLHTNILQVLETVILYPSLQEILLPLLFNRNSCEARETDQYQKLKFFPETWCSFVSTLPSWHAMMKDLQIQCHI